MKKLKIIALFIFFVSEIKAQNILKTSDSTLAKYLESSLRFVSTGDTCFSGIYNMTFGLSKKNEIIEFDCSATLPKSFATKIKDLMLSLNGKWNSEFIYRNQKQKFVQPIFLSIESNCTDRKLLRHTDSTSKLTPNLGESSFSDKDYMDMLMSVIKLFVSAQNTWSSFNISLI